MDYSTPGFPLLHHCPELAQTHVHWLSDAIQPSHPLSPSSSCLPIRFRSVQLLSHVRLFVTPRTTAHQASLSFTISWSLLKLMSIESVMLSSHLILCRPLLLLPSIFPSIRIFSNESSLHIRWPKYWSFVSASVHPMNIYDWFPLGLNGLISLQSKGLSRIFSSTTVQKHKFFGAQPLLWSNSHIHIWLLEKL